MLNLYRDFLFAFVILMFVVSCAGVARMSDFPKSSDVLNFNDIASHNYEYDGAVWNQKTEYEYYLAVSTITEEELFDALSEALKLNGYEIAFSDKNARTIIGERGLRANEWNSITGIYYTIKDVEFQVFIKNEITQDFTGGWRENRAKKVATTLCSEIIQCTK